MTEALRMALLAGTDSHSITEKLRPRFVSRFLDHADCIVGIDCLVRDGFSKVGLGMPTKRLLAPLQVVS